MLEQLSAGCSSFTRLIVSHYPGVAQLLEQLSEGCSSFRRRSFTSPHSPHSRTPEISQPASPHTPLSLETTNESSEFSLVLVEDLNFPQFFTDSRKSPSSSLFASFTDHFHKITNWPPSSSKESLENHKKMRVCVARSFPVPGVGVLG